MDWNNDGKKDLLLGEAYGKVLFYLNVGTDAAPVFNTNSYIQVGASQFTAGNYSAPCVVDWNNDGKKDLLVGNYNGTIFLLVNTGTDVAPAFSQSALIQDGAAALNVGNWSAPLAVDWDRDGKKDLLVGNADGVVRFYRNQGTDASPTFSGFTNLIAGGTILDVGTYSHPALTDWNSDGGSDLVVGCYDGVVKCFGVVKKSTVVYDSVALDDAAGNGDGVINPGETVDLLVALKNLGLDPATGVTARISTSDAYVSVDTSMATVVFGDMPGDGVARDGQTAYRILVGASCPTPREVTLNLAVSDSGTNAWPNSFRVMVYASSQISGTVTRDGAPLAGATIRYAGPFTGSVQTKADGTYMFGAIDGTYTLVAGMGDYLDAAPREVIVPPSTGGVDFAFTTASISGAVRDMLTGLPIPGAAVEYAGPISGVVTSAADGTYTITRVFGRVATLTLTAKHPSYFDSDPQTLTAPPNSSGVNFELATADIAVSPASLIVEGYLHQVVTRALSITNEGGAEMKWSIWNQMEAPTGTFAAGDVRREFGVPTTNYPYGVAFDGSVLWVSEGYYGSVLSKLDPMDGHLVGTLNVGSTCAKPWGLAWDGAKIWIAGYYDKKIYAVDPTTGAKLKEFAAPNGISPTGIAFDGASLWVMPYSYGTNTIYRLDPNDGSVQGQISTPTNIVGYKYSLTYFNGALWMAPYSGGGKIYKISAQDGSVQKSFQGPADNSLLGIDSDRASGLWCLGYSTKKMYLVDSGEVTWLTEDPSSGAVVGLGRMNVMVSFTGTKAGVGTHAATIHVASNDPDERDVPVPVTYTVLDDNRPPQIGGYTPATPCSLAEGSSQAFTVSASDPDGDEVSREWRLDGTKVAGNTNRYVYAPGYTAAGPHQILVAVRDPFGGAVTQVWAVTVTEVTDPPVASNQTVTVTEDTPKPITLVATDKDGDTLTYAVLTTPTKGKLSGTAPNVTYTPNTNYAGGDSFTFRASDGRTNSNVATVTLSVTAVNDAPVPQNQTVTTAKDTSKAIVLSATDVEKDTLIYSIAATPAHGSLSSLAGSNVTYTPVLNYTGLDRFLFTVADGKGGVATGKVGVAVESWDPHVRLSLDADGGLTLEWDAGVDWEYAIEYRDSLVGGTWQVLQDWMSGGGTSQLSVSCGSLDTNAVPNRFYRVKARVW